MVYNINKPASGDNLSVSQGDIQGNFSTANIVMAIDHYPFNDNTAFKGYHKAVHMVAQAAPIAVASTVAAYAASYTPNTTGGVASAQLFTINGAGVTSQLTGRLNGTDGWVWCSGILIQWGILPGTTSGSFPSGAAAGTVTFKDRVVGAIPFPNTCFVVIPVPTFNAAAPNGAASVNINTATLTNLKFDWKFNSNSGAYTGFQWVAIGN